MTDYSFILDGIRWSYSSVSTYDTCPLAFKLGYIDSLPKLNNAFAEFGSFAHSILERYYRGEIEFFELAELYREGYRSHVTSEFPESAFCNLADRYYADGQKYFDEFEGDFDDCKVVEVENKVLLSIAGRQFVGIIDLLLERDGKYIIVDHKSKKSFKSKQEEREYLRQLYIYATYVKEKYGKYPKLLIFNLIRNTDHLVQHEFVESEYREAISWFSLAINSIYSDSEFISTPQRIRRQSEDAKQALADHRITQPDYIKQVKKLESELKGMKFYCEELCSSRCSCDECNKA